MKQNHSNHIENHHTLLDFPDSLTIVWLVWAIEVSRIWLNRDFEASIVESNVSRIVFWYTSAWRIASSIQEAAFSTVVVAILALGIEERRGCGGGDCGIAGDDECESSISEDDSPEVAISKKKRRSLTSLCFAQSFYPVNGIEMTRI